VLFFSPVASATAHSLRESYPIFSEFFTRSQAAKADDAGLDRFVNDPRL
jgi:hypothetical protein